MMVHTVLAVSLVVSLAQASVVGRTEMPLLQSLIDAK
jgi:hypothetical protein